MISFSCGPTEGWSSIGGLGISLRWATITAKLLSAWNGRCPVTISYSEIPSGVQIGAGVRRFAIDLLRRHVAQRAGRRAGHRDRLVVALARNAEIRQLHDAARRQHHVGRLDVAVHHVLRMGIAQRVESLLARSSAASAIGIGPCFSRCASVCPSTNSMIITSWLSAVSAVRSAAMLG